jgi:HEAT repeat protein/V8-like Glu-specific endopeptidase
MSIELNYSLQQNKALYNNKDQRQNLAPFESSELNQSFISTVKKQAESVACLIYQHFLIKQDDGGWELSPKTPTFAQVMKHEFQEKDGNHETFGEQERFCDEYAAGFGTAFLVGKQFAMTAAHCICIKDTNILDEKVIAATRIVFAFQNADKLFADRQVYQIKKVIRHQFTIIQDKHQDFTEWADWALVELDREAPYTPLKMNMTKRVADKVELYMLGHPYGLPVKFVGNGFIQGNTQKDFFESNLDPFGGNSGSPVFNKITCEVEGMLCSGGEDYEITDNYRGTHQRRIQAQQITKQESGQKGFEICQRLNVLRFLLDDHLLKIDGQELPQNSTELILHSLKERYKSHDTIPRLLHSDLPINEIYTELVLINKNKENDKKAFDEHSINSWEEIHAAKEPIELPSIFENKEGPTRQRLLIIGRAGSGKSTLCQHIAHQWAEGKLWKEKFDALFWVPLRQLQHAHSAETVSSFIFHHCCHDKSENLYANDFANYLKHNQERILFVLDGLDEVSMEANSLQKGIIDELLKFPNWITTSRPHAARSIQADSTIENVGFASKTIDLYVKKSFQENGQAILQKIRQNPIIFGLCHIPINLELVCSILKKSQGDIASIISMTGLYEELSLVLKKKFLVEKIGISKAWDWIERDFHLHQDDESDMKKIKTRIKKIFITLEQIAWTGMEQKQLYFSFNGGKMGDIYFDSYSSSEVAQREPLFIDICTSGFLQSSGVNEKFLKNEYSFLNLTFQEFFAARYLVRLLQNQPLEAAKWIGGVKFDPRYKIVMWFVAGLLKNEGGDFEGLNAFFEILDTPKDAVGLYSTLLKVRCLEECGSPNQLKHLKLYQQDIHSWCKIIGFNPKGNPVVSHIMETFKISPEGSKRFLIPHLNSCLTNNDLDWEIKQEVIQALGRIGGDDPQSVLPLLADALKDINQNIRQNAAEVLGKIGLHADPRDVLPLLAKTLEDEDEDVRVAALDALGKIDHADQQFVLPLLAKTLKDKSREIRECAIRALGIIGLHADPQSVLPLLADALKDEDEDVRRAALDALGMIGHVDPQNALPLLADALKDEDVKEAALDALEIIGHVDPQSVLPLLADALKDEDVDVRQGAVKSIGQIGGADSQFVLPLLAKALRDEAWQVRNNATKVLSKIGQVDPQYVLPLLAEASKDKDYNVRKNAGEALGHIGQTDPQGVLPLLAEASKDKAAKVREYAIKALGNIGQVDLQGVLPLLTDALKDDDWNVRICAADVFGKIGHADPQIVLPLLAQALKDHDWVVRMDAAGAFGQIGHTDPQSVLPLLAKALKDEKSRVRRDVAEALGKVGQADPQGVLPLLADARIDEDGHVREAAVKALGIVGRADPQSVLPLLAEALRDALRDEDGYVRRPATSALGEIGHANPQSALPLIIEALQYARSYDHNMGAYFIQMTWQVTLNKMGREFCLF